MKIKTKLALLYTSITVGILAVVFVFVYIITSKSIDNNYYTLLSEKALITAQKYFEKDELNQTAYQKILDIYKDLLPETSERIITANDIEDATTELQSFLNKKQLRALFSKKQLKFKLDQFDAVGIYYSDNEGDFVVIVAAENMQGQYIKDRLENILIVILLVSCICIFALLWWNTGIITKPLQQMVKRMQAISAKELHLRLDERKGNDELAQTIRYFNQMIERLEISFNSQKTFISNASHEFKNPLTAIMGECEVMQLKDFSPDEYRDAIKRIEVEVDRLDILTRNLLTLAQTDLDISESDMEELDVVEELHTVVNYFEQSKYRGRVDLGHTPLSFCIKANKQLLFVAFQNLIDNACKYSDKQVKIGVLTDKNGLKIIIADEGIGIPNEEQDKIFNAFYRAQNAHNHKGSGIGLSLAHRILKLSGADLSMESTINKGTTILISWENKF